MVIAVNTRFLLKDYLEGYGNFTFECFSRLAIKYPQHQFIYIFDRPFDPAFITSPNITPVVTGPQARHPLLWKYWFDYKLPAVLRKHKADVFVSADGFCSLRTSVPQCLVIHDLAFLHHPEFIKKSHCSFYKKYTPKFLQKAKTVITVSEFSKQDILKHYKTPEDKIDVVFNGVKEIFKPLDWKEKEAVKDKYTDGREYFLYTGSIHPRKNLTNLLKAFSVFKKWQKSNMRLVIAGRLAWNFEEFTKSLQSYKYRNDVVLTGYLPSEELARVTGAAYAMVYPSFFEGFGVPLIEAMKSEVPVITSSMGALKETGGDAALYADPADPDSIAQKMLLLFKDETLRTELIEKGKARAMQFNWDAAADLLWESILKTA